MQNIKSYWKLCENVFLIIMYVSNNDFNKKQSEFEWKNYGVFVSFPVKTDAMLNLFMQFTGFSLYGTSK